PLARRRRTSQRPAVTSESRGRPSTSLLLGTARMGRLACAIDRQGHIDHRTPPPKKTSAKCFILGRNNTLRGRAYDARRARRSREARDHRGDIVLAFVARYV